MESEITPVQQMLASCSGALVTSLFVTPLDVVKIRLQSQTASINRKCFVYCNGLMDHLCVCLNGNGKNTWYKRPGHFNGTFDAIIKISRHEGVPALWSGLSPTLVMAVPATVLYFTSYDQLKTKMQRKFGNYTLIPAVAGGIARTGTVTIISPLELIRTKMQSRPLTYQELASVIRQSLQTSGVRSLWTGWWSTIMRDVPFSMVYWFAYETFKKKSQIDNMFVSSFVSGFSAGTVASVITNPMDVVKTRRQVALGEQVLGVSNSPTASTISILQNIIKDHGFKGVFAGLLPRIAKIGPACAIMISSYEFGKRFFHDHNGIHAFEEEHPPTDIRVLNPVMKT